MKTKDEILELVKYHNEDLKQAEKEFKALNDLIINVKREIAVLDWVLEPGKGQEDVF